MLSAPPTEAFDRIASLAQRLFDVPMALVNVIDDEAQWCLSSAGLDLDRVSLDNSFCVHTIDQGDMMVIEDLRADDRFAENPFVIGAPHVRFYAGASLRAPNGCRLGTLCLLDDEPRTLSDDGRRTLMDLADIVVDELELRHHAADLQSAKQTLKAAKEEAERASRLKSSFLANLSHDVRTPLSSILSLTELLSMEVGEEHQERIRLIERSSHRLLDTIDSVLDLSKLESGTVEPDWEEVDLVDELLGTAEIFRPQAKEAGLTLVTDVDEPLTAALDPTMLHRIVDNLLSNAIKFTPEGGTVWLRGHDAGDAVAIEVEDTGVGIDEDFRPDLFESFARGTNQVEAGGSGLGLAITKRLTEVMDGTIKVESEPDVGTCFTVRFPRS